MGNNVDIIVSGIMDKINELPYENRRQALVDIIVAVNKAIGVNLPENCYHCEYCEYKEQTSYMPYKECQLNREMIYYNNKNGYTGRMKWCPLERKEEQQENGV